MAVKVNWVRKLRNFHKSNFIWLQETQLTHHENLDITACWGDQDYDYEGVDSDGRSGRLVLIWNITFFSEKRSNKV